MRRANERSLCARVVDQVDRRGGLQSAVGGLRSAVCGRSKSEFRCEQGERSGPGPQTADLLFVFFCPIPSLVRYFPSPIPSLAKRGRVREGAT
jgi:hypothetical protein